MKKARTHPKGGNPWHGLAPGRSSHIYIYSYLLGLLAMIKCSICSYQCDNWYTSPSKRRAGPLSRIYIRKSACCMPGRSAQRWVRKKQRWQRLLSAWPAWALLDAPIRPRRAAYLLLRWKSSMIPEAMASSVPLGISRTPGGLVARPSLEDLLLPSEPFWAPFEKGQAGDSKPQWTSEAWEETGETQPLAIACKLSLPIGSTERGRLTSKANKPFFWWAGKALFLGKPHDRHIPENNLHRCLGISAAGYLLPVPAWGWEIIWKYLQNPSESETGHLGVCLAIYFVAFPDGVPRVSVYLKNWAYFPLDLLK